MLNHPCPHKSSYCCFRTTAAIPITPAHTPNPWAPPEPQTFIFYNLTPRLSPECLNVSGARFLATMGELVLQTPETLSPCVPILWSGLHHCSVCHCISQSEVNTETEYSATGTLEVLLPCIYSHPRVQIYICSTESTHQTPMPSPLWRSPPPRAKLHIKRDPPQSKHIPWEKEIRRALAVFSITVDTHGFSYWGPCSPCWHGPQGTELQTQSHWALLWVQQPPSIKLAHSHPHRGEDLVHQNLT